MDINQEKINELRNRMEKDAETLKRDFRAYDSKLDNTTTKQQHYDLENAIEERVHLAKFRRLEKNVTDYCRKEEFCEYKIMMEETLLKIRDEFKPLEKTTEVNSKVRTVQNRFEKMSKTFSVK